jgi:hypothetical protein
MQNAAILKIDLLRKFVAGVYLSEAQNPNPPPLHIVYMYTVYLFTQAGRAELNQREGERGLKVYYSCQSWVCIYQHD